MSVVYLAYLSINPIRIQSSYEKSETRTARTNSRVAGSYYMRYTLYIVVIAATPGSNVFDTACARTRRQKEF